MKCADCHSCLALLWPLTSLTVRLTRHWHLNLAARLPAELAEYMGIELDSFEKDRGNARQFETYSIEVVTDEVMNLPDQSSRQPDAIVEEAQMMEALTGAIDQLPERDKLVISLYYVEELNLREIGEVLGVSNHACRKFCRPM